MTIDPLFHFDRRTPPPPPPLDQLPAGTKLVAGCGHATVLPDMDFETYSEAGWVWDAHREKWVGPPGAAGNKRGLELVGAAVYTEHPSADVLSLYYDLKDGHGRRHWRPDLPPPLDLWCHIEGGGVIEAWNSSFEHWVWVNILVPKYNWPDIATRQFRCAMAKARAFALPGALADAGSVLGITHHKDPEGKRLLTKFSRPRTPTKTDRRLRVLPADEPEDAKRLYAYNERDILAESETSSLTPDLMPDELEFWLCDQEINFRGCAVDTKAIADCINIIEQAYERYNSELRNITGGQVELASQLERLKGWLAGRGVHLLTADEDAIDEALKLPNLDPAAKRALEIRSLVGSASVKKLYALALQTTTAGRVHDLFSFHAARTGRATANGPQPHNLPKSGPTVSKCGGCGRWSAAEKTRPFCPWCGGIVGPPKEWNPSAIEDALTVIATRSLDCVEMFFGNAVLLVQGCIRGLFIASNGHDLIASDYAGIEAVVTAALAGEQWRLDVFGTHGKIYEISASKVTGIPFEDFQTYKDQTGQHRPERQKVGKCLELACGYGGWVNATKAENIRMDVYFSDEEIAGHIKRWRAESPAIVELWGGQHRSAPWRADYRREYFGLEGMAILAVLNPGEEFTYRAPHPLAQPISYFTRAKVLYCRLPSDRLLTYHNPRLRPSTHRDNELELVFDGWNTNPKMGPIGWNTMKLYGGKLTENVVQAVSRDILRDAIIRMRPANYPVVLHVHDEIVGERRHGEGSLEEFETTMNVMPAWATGWPIKAKGGWRGKRYRKD